DLGMRLVTPKKTTSQDDSFILAPAKDLALQPDNARKADALADFVEGIRLEENAEMESALAAYQRVFTFDPCLSELAQRFAALLTLDRAANVKSDDAGFWIRLGKLYAPIIFKSENEPKPEELKRVNGFFEKAVARAGEDSAALKEVADYYAASQQIQEAIPLYL